jgi:hypothetical protein
VTNICVPYPCLLDNPLQNLFTGNQNIDPFKTFSMPAAISSNHHLCWTTWRKDEIKCEL